MTITLEPIDLTKISRQYVSKWIALSLDMHEVYVSGHSVTEIKDKVSQKGLALENVIITKLPHPDTCIVV